MRLGIVGLGYWGSVYSRVLTKLGIDHWQKGRDWTPDADGLIVACSTESHYEVAFNGLRKGLPVLVEKPVCFDSSQVLRLIGLGGIAFAGHTRLYSPEWAEFRDRHRFPLMVSGEAGGVNEGNPDAVWNWIPHLASMAIDLGADLDECLFRVGEARKPLRLEVDGDVFRDAPDALDGLVRAFVAAIERGEPNNDGLRLGYRVVQFTERVYESRGLHGGEGQFGRLAAPLGLDHAD